MKFQHHFVFKIKETIMGGNELYLVSNFVVERFQDNILVNTVAFEKTEDIDLNKANIYPLVNIDLTDSVNLDSLLQFNFNITILQQRDTEPELNNDKIFGSNLIDNLNKTHSIATRFINGIRATHDNDADIEVMLLSNLVMQKYTGTNLLDGVQFLLSLTIPNTTPC